MKSQPKLFAGMGSHHSAKPKTTVWLTPPDIIEELGPFDLDPCGAPGWDTARRHYYEADNGLALPWSGRVWLNPPYTVNEIRQWMWKLQEHDCGTALVFARTEAQWFFESVWGKARALLFMEGRINFYTARGIRAKGNAGAPSVLAAYGDLDTDKLAAADIRGEFVLLQNRHWCVLGVPKTWAQVVAESFAADSVLSLGELYERLEGHPKTANNNNWQAKIRQIVQLNPRFRRLRPGVYEVCS